MLYRENGQFKTSYIEDQQILPIVQDRTVVAAGPGIDGVSLAGAVPAGVVADAPNWWRTTS